LSPSRPTESKEKSSTGKQSKTIDSLAILPLENAGGDPETEYLSDGIAETLINTLAQLRKIRVVPRTLSFQYRGTGGETLKAGHELGVKAVLAGRMIQRGDDLTVSVETGRRGAPGAALGWAVQPEVRRPDCFTGRADNGDLREAAVAAHGRGKEETSQAPHTE